MCRRSSLYLPKLLAGYFTFCDGALAVLFQIIPRVGIVVDSSSDFEDAGGCEHVRIDVVPEEECRCIVCGREAEVRDY